MVGKAFHTGVSACVWHMYFRIQKYSFGHMAVCREIVYHGQNLKNICVCRIAETSGVKSGRTVRIKNT